jgi:hypothetical protein
VFLPKTTGSLGTRLLICDGHRTHIDIEFMFLAKQNNVQMVFLPPYYSHILQPLDLGVFSLIKSKYRRLLNTHASFKESTPIRKIRFTQCYNIARRQGLIKSNILEGFKAAGIYP